MRSASRSPTLNISCWASNKQQNNARGKESTGGNTIQRDGMLLAVWCLVFCQSSVGERSFDRMFMVNGGKISLLVLCAQKREKKRKEKFA
jgi:hypothetical protein